MRSVFLNIALFFICSQGFPQDRLQIMSVLETQTECWNKGDLECFMEGYWKSDSLKFIGKNGINYGWQSTLDNYKKRYPDKTAMGKLDFEILEVSFLSDNSASVVGKWHLTRTVGDLGGYFTLLWKKMKDKWVIVQDHSS